MYVYVPAHRRASSQGGLKDVEKEVKRQTKLYAQHQAALEKSPDYIGALRAALRASSEGPCLYLDLYLDVDA